LICYRCATPIPNDSRFCLSCGTDVSGATSGERTQPVEVDAELQTKLQEDLGGDFAIERQIGRGGMAAVFLAQETHLERRVAIKVLPPELTYGSGMIERFKREAKVAATLDHPHIIPIHRVSTGGKIFWYAMKYLEGASLADIIERDAPLPLAKIADVLQQVAEALDYAHERGVIHRDVKPANVMIDSRGWATVTDFGIAKAASQTSMTGSGSMIGTPYYMSPEQCSGKKITGASDQYSLGVMAFQMLSGHLPFTGETVIEIVKKHCTDPVPPIGVLRPGISPAIVAVVERALAKAPEERFATAGDFAAAFADAAEVEHSGIPRLTARATAGPVPRRRSVTADVSPPAPKPSGAAPRDTARQRERVWLKVALAAVVAVATPVAMFWHPGARSTVGDQRPAPDTARPAIPGQRAPRGDTDSTTDSAGPGIKPPELAPAPEPRPGPAAVGVRERRATRRVAAESAARTPETSAPVAAPSVTPHQAAVLPETTAAASDTTEAPSGTGSVFVWSNPPVPFTINGRRYEANPTTVTDLAAGPVTIRFEATESTAAFEKTVRITPGQTVRTGRIPLPRKP
jgi:hypothetical protein